MESSDIDIFSAAFVHLLFQLFGRQRPRCGNPVVVPVVIDRGVIETPSLAVSWDFCMEVRRNTWNCASKMYHYKMMVPDAVWYNVRIVNCGYTHAAHALSAYTNIKHNPPSN